MSDTPVLRRGPIAGDAKPRPTKKLPTFRVGYEKQMDALRAYAVLSENGTKGVHYGKIADIIKVHEANVSSMNPFFVEVGFIEKREPGYMPTAPVIEYNRQYSWNQETAAQKLAPIIANSWFGQALGHRLQFRAMTEEQAIETLAAECGAGPEAKPQLRMLLDYCQSAGLLERNNGQVSMPAMPWLKTPAAQEPEPAPSSPPPQPASPGPTTRPAPSVVLTPGQESSIHLNIGIEVNLAEMKDWPADRIAAFFAGIAQVLAAKNADG
jgi:hypothetical protein